jgi:hypothetical protein
VHISAKVTQKPSSFLCQGYHYMTEQSFETTFHNIASSCLQKAYFKNFAAFLANRIWLRSRVLGRVGLLQHDG